MTYHLLAALLYPVMRMLKYGQIDFIYGLSGSQNFRQFEHRVTVFTANSECKCWSRFTFSIGVYGSKMVFSLPFVEYCSNLQTD